MLSSVFVEIFSNDEGNGKENNLKINVCAIETVL